jgi:hypothetical protein
MNNKLCLTLCIAILLLTFSQLTHATKHQQEPLPPLLADPYVIATVADAEVFYQYTNKLPSVVNYFTAYSQQQIIDFYQDKYGIAKKKQIVGSRITLYFTLEKTSIKVNIAPQDGKQQVDIIVT